MPRRTILIADPKPEIRQFVKNALRGEEWRVIEARGGLEALCVCACRPVDLLLIAKDLPGIDGVRVVEKLSHPFPTLRVLYLGGGEDAIGKPLDADDLRERIGRALESATIRKSPANEAASGEAARLKNA